MTLHTFKRSLPYTGLGEQHSREQSSSRFRPFGCGLPVAEEHSLLGLALAAASGATFVDGPLLAGVVQVELQAV